MYLVFMTMLVVGSLSTSALAEDGAQQKASSFNTTDKTNIDFSETLVDGKMQAPQGFFLQGRQAQSMTQMVRLRSKFRSELRNSRSAVKAIVR